MIIQCDQCNTKFKLDDAKVPDRGIKVRCARCKQVFMVQKEIASEEPDFDTLLSGLGTPASGAGQAVTSPGAAVSSAVKDEEWQIAAQVPATPEERGEETAAGDALEQAKIDEAGGEFFAGKEKSVVPEEKGFVYGEFSFEGEDANAPSAEMPLPADSTETGGALDTGEFSFEAEAEERSDTSVAATGIPSDVEGFEFEARDLAADETTGSGAGPWLGSAVAEKTAAEEFSFAAEESAPRAGEPAMDAKAEFALETGEEFDFGAFGFAPEEAQRAESTPLIAAEEKKEEEAATPEFAAGEFGHEKVAEPDVPGHGESEEEFVFTSEPATEAAPVSSLPLPTTADESEAKPSFASQMPYAEEELPPLAITSRKKGRSVFSIAVTAFIVLVVLAVAGVGLYVLKVGPAAFDKLGLSSLAKWAGVEVAGEGGIAIKNPQGAFMMNKEAGEIFVVTGEAVNNFRKPRASIQVKATVLGAKGEVLALKTAYCGNVLSKEQLASMPVAKIEESMGSPFGDSLINLGVQPGKSIPFVVVFTNVPKNSAEFSVEVIGSTAAD